MTEPRVSIIALTYNQLDTATKPFLQSLYKYTKPEDFELIVVDNASKDGTAAYLKTFASAHPNMKLILNDDNRGFSGGNNDGLRLAAAPYSIYINNDIYFTPNWLETLIKPLEDENIGLSGPITNYGHWTQIVKIEGVNKDNYLEKYSSVLQNKLVETDFLGGFCIAARTSFLRKLGGFDEAFNPAFYEDDDLSLRSRYEGKKNIINHNVYLYHNARSSTGSIKNAYLSEINTRNKTYFNKKHYTYIVQKRAEALRVKYGQNLAATCIIAADKFLFNIKENSRSLRRKFTKLLSGK